MAKRQPSVPGLITRLVFEKMGGWRLVVFLTVTIALFAYFKCHPLPEGGLIRQETPAVGTR